MNVELEYVIIILGLAGAGPQRTTIHDGKFLAAYNPDGNSVRPYGFPVSATLDQGEITSTWHESHAMTFPSFEAVGNFWKQTVGTKLRPDGEPNRPLTAFHVEILSRVKVPYPERFELKLSSEDAERKCKIGQGASTCRFVGMTAEGWSCLYATPLRTAIELRASTMKAKAGPCRDPLDSTSEAVL